MLLKKSITYSHRLFMRNKAFLTLIISFLLSLSSNQLFSQEVSVEKETFKPSGNIIMRGFLDFRQGLSNNTSKERGMDVTRALLGYNYKITPTLQAQVVIDGASGKSEEGESEVYLRNAFLRWKDKGFDISAGQIGLLQFKTQEDYWSHRYIMKSFQDENKMGSSVDLGITAKYNFSPILSADISLTNGEGYKRIEKNNSTRYGVGLSLYPIKNIILRAYGDIYTKSEDLFDALPDGVTTVKHDNQYTLSLFAGYQNDKVSGGIEYNRLYNKGFIQKKDYYGYSLYSTLRVAPKWNIFARYDLADSYNPSGFTDPWYDKDGQLMVIGAEFQPLKQIKISPNIRNINADRRDSEQYIFINLEFNL